MTFVSRFIGLRIALAIPEREIDVDLRLKIPQHPDENDGEVVARVVAMCHAFEEGVALSRGRFETDEPSFWKHSLTGEIALWAEVGIPPVNRFRRFIRQSKSGPTLLYLMHAGDEEQLFLRLYSERLHFPRTITIRRVDPATLVQISDELSTSQRWHLTFVDDTGFLTTDSSSHEIVVEEVDLEAEYGRWRDLAHGSPGAVKRSLR